MAYEKLADRTNKEAQGEMRDQMHGPGLRNDSQKISKSFTVFHAQGLHPLIRIIPQ